MPAQKAKRGISPVLLLLDQRSHPDRSERKLRLRRSVPVWVVRARGQVDVRTWHRRANGWFGQAVDSQRAQIRLPGPEVDVAVEDVGDDHAELRAGVDAAYRDKYGGYGATALDRTVTDDAAASNLRLIPER